MKSLVAVLSVVLSCNSLVAAEAAEFTFDSLAGAFVDGLRSSDFTDFVREHSTTVEQLRNAGAEDSNPQADSNLPEAFRPRRLADEQIDNIPGQWQQSLQTSLDHVLKQLKEMNLDPGKANITLESVTASPKSVYFNPANLRELAWFPKVTWVTRIETKQQSAQGTSLSGSYSFQANGCVDLSGVWCLTQGVQLIGAPPAVFPPEQELAFRLQSLASTNGKITAREDSRLGDVAEVVLDYLSTGDTDRVLESLMISQSEVMQRYEAFARERGITPPKEAEIAGMIGFVAKQHREKAEQFLRTARALELPIDRDSYTVTEVRAEHPRYRQSGAPDMVIEANHVEITLSLTSTALESFESSYAGDYKIVVDRGDRLLQRWTFMEGIRWAEFPTGLLTADQAKQLREGNYIATQGALPPGTKMPKFSFFGLDEGEELSSEELENKVVILEFWASWCGPCQGPMEDLQKYVKDHPEWAGKVEVIALSIDDPVEDARRHLQRKGWDATRNVWAGSGGWQSGAAKAFSVRGIPTAYIIDKEGIIVASGRFFDIPDQVDRLLKR